MEGRREVESIALGDPSQSDIVQGCLIEVSILLISSETFLTHLFSCWSFWPIAVSECPTIRNMAEDPQLPQSGTEFHYRILHKLPLYSSLYSLTCVILSEFPTSFNLSAFTGASGRLLNDRFSDSLTFPVLPHLCKDQFLW